MIEIKPQRVEIEAFNVVGLSVRTQNALEFNTETAKLPRLWQQFSTTQKPDSPVNGVYSEYETDATGFYTVTAGVDINAKETPSSLSVVTVAKGSYLVFRNSGPIPDAVIETWQAIWHYFNSQSDFVRAYYTDFEVYLGQEECEVYIGIKT